jgi:GNAT superfamily N-acetyltransferase
MRITSVDMADPASLDLLLPCLRAVHADGFPDNPAMTRTQGRLWFGESYQETGVGRLAWVDDAVVGYAVQWWSHHRDRDLSQTHLAVHPAFRRRGIGRALHAEAVEQARAGGRRRLLIDGAGNDTVSAFAGAVGAKQVFTDQRGKLDLTTVDRARVTALRDGTGQPAGYTLVGWVGHCPDELVVSLAAAKDAMNDAPRDGIALDRHVPSVVELRHREQQLIAAGARAYTLAAVSDDTGEICGFTDVEVTDSTLAAQEDTAVLPAHRGHRLGLWLKSSMLLRLLDAEPQLTAMETWNAASNSHMLAVNTALGWQPAGIWYCYQSDV